MLKAKVESAMTHEGADTALCRREGNIRHKKSERGRDAAIDVEDVAVDEV